MTIHQNEGPPLEADVAMPELTSAEQHLLALCLASVQTVDRERLRAAATTTGPLRPEMLLTLIAYSYARGHYDSRNIAAGTASDAALRYLCAGTRPVWTDLRRFRRHHRDLVAQCLTWVLEQATALPSGEREECFRMTEWSSPSLSDEVANRLGTAALMDGADSE